MTDLIGQLVLCLLAADFLTGVVHWWEDTYGLPTWPLVGPVVIVPNIEHHRYPTRMSSMATLLKLVDRNWQATLLAAAVLAVLSLAGCWSWQLGLIAALASCGNEVHRCTHVKCGPVARFLQETGCIQSPQQHARHHRGSFDRYYCTLTDFVNPTLERVEFWRRAERLIATLSGITPKRCTPAREGF